MDIAEEKQAQRTSGKAARRALSPEQRAAANAALCARKECKIGRASCRERV